MYPFPVFRYPTAFLNKVKAELPDDFELHKQLDNNGVYSVELSLKQHNRPDLLSEFEQIWRDRPRERQLIMVDG